MGGALAANDKGQMTMSSKPKRLVRYLDVTKCGQWEAHMLLSFRT